MVIDKARSVNKLRLNQSVNMNLDVRTLTILCRYVLSSSSYLRLSHLVNLKKLMIAINPDMYQNDMEKSKRVEFIAKALEARIDCKLIDQEMIITHVFSHIDFQPDFIDMQNLEMNQDELVWVHDFVEESLKYFFIYDNCDELLELCTKIKTSDFNQRTGLIKNFKEVMDKSNNYFREVRQDTNVTDISFSLRDGEFEKSIQDTWNLITNPSRRLITGMQGLNEMLGGGFESGRTYMFLGLTGMGKSLVLLNLAYQMKKCNRFYKPKDPTKTPCIVMLTMENTVVETITRLFDLSVENSIGMENYSVEEVLRKLRQEGQLVLNDDSPIDIVIRYKANKSVDTNYLYELTDDLESEGYEVICLIQDHVKRIRSVWGASDLRLELGDIVNEFKVFAAEKDIPVITNSHLNRDASRIVEEDGARVNKTDITMRLGKSNAGESLLMLDNLDQAFIINPDFDEEGNKYMVFKSIKERIKNARMYIVQPFAYGSAIKLVEDLGGEPMFKESLHINRDINNRFSNIRTSSTNLMVGVNQMMPQNQDNAFAETSKAYTMTLDEPDNYEMPIMDGPKIITPIRFVDKGSPEGQKLSLDSLANLKMTLDLAV